MKPENSGTLQKFRDAISSKNPDLEWLASWIRSSDRILSDALANLTLKNETIRYNSYRALRIISKSDPMLLYPHWDFFVSQISSQNTYHILSGIHILADLTRVDDESRFEAIHGQFYDLLNHKSMVVVSHVSQASGRILLNKPLLREKIEAILLGIDTCIGQHKHQDLIKAHVMEAFTEAREVLILTERVRQFALSLTDSSESPKCRKLAKEFLNHA
jgi:hypothetical protein